MSNFQTLQLMENYRIVNKWEPILGWSFSTDTLEVTFVMDHYATDRKWKQDSLLDHMKWNQFIAQETHLARYRWHHPRKGCLKMMSPYKWMVYLHTTWRGCLFHLYRFIYLLLQSCNASFSDLMFPRKNGKSVSLVIFLDSNLYNVTWCLTQIHTIFMRFFLPMALWSLTWSTIALRKRSLEKLFWCPPFPLYNLANKNSCLGSI